MHDKFLHLIPKIQFETVIKKRCDFFPPQPERLESEKHEQQEIKGKKKKKQKEISTIKKRQLSV